MLGVHQRAPPLLLPSSVIRQIVMFSAEGHKLKPAWLADVLTASGVVLWA